MARTTTYSQSLADEMCVRIAEGESMRSICRDKKAKMPGLSTVFRWLSENDKFKEQYDEACRMRADTLFDEMFEIADDKKGDVNRDRLRLDTRKWALARMSPKKYGDKVQHADADGNKLEISIKQFTS